jgi:hypothetical protein
MQKFDITVFAQPKSARSPQSRIPQVTSSRNSVAFLGTLAEDSTQLRTAAFGGPRMHNGALHRESIDDRQLRRAGAQP